MKTFSIGSTLIDLPDFLDTRLEEDTLVAYPPKTDFANLRFTVITIKKDGQEKAGAGERLIRKEAAKAGAKLYEDKGRVWYYYTEASSEGSPGSLMHYWYVGMGGHMLVISCFIDSAKKENPLTKQVLDAVVPAIKSFRQKGTEPIAQ